QIHFQVSPKEFARLYNLAQLISAPVLAAAANSPLLLGNRLWRETRVALFQRSVEERSTHHQARGNRPRVHFGSGWVREGVVELFREDITRYRLILAGVPEEDPLAILAEGRPPQLSALRLHNSTVWRWNRPCYGVVGDKAHLRIENRILPAGPTVLDEMANAALFFGLMSEMSHDPEPVSERLPFDDAMNNFFAAARLGLKAQFSWFDGKHLSASQLIRDELLPRARDGLRRSQIDEADIERYLGVIERRVETNHTGAQWIMGSIASFGDKVTRDVRDRTITAALLTRQQSGRPVHEWSLAVAEESRDWRDSYRTVGQFMTTDLFTVRPDDIVDLAASMMEWEHIRHVPVEDDDGRLVGLVSHRDLLRLVSRGTYGKSNEPHLVREIMATEPVTVGPETKTMDAVRTMRKHDVSSLPVVQQGRLLGIVTEHDLLIVAYRLLEAFLDDERRSTPEH
ncbi:MAG: CBS domain-containing protein, partial [Myxococcales bacterium]|nr:CBS domain-containing protein [Myxococcales bacterium]